MALKLADVYQYFVAANAAYPGGSFKDASAPGAQDGTPVEKQWLNDWLGFFAALMAQGGVAYSGAPDTALVSQYLTALQNIINASNVDKVDGYHASLTPGALQIPVFNAGGQLSTPNGDLVFFGTDGAGASTLPQTFANGYTTFEASPAGAWPASYGQVYVLRHGTRVDQEFRPAGGGKVYRRSAVTDSNTWGAWITDANFLRYPLISSTRYVGTSIVGSINSTLTLSVPSADYIVELDMSGSQAANVNVELSATVNGTKKTITPLGPVNYVVIAGGTLRWYLTGVTSITIQPLFTNLSFDQCQLTIQQVGY